MDGEKPKPDLDLEPSGEVSPMALMDLKIRMEDMRGVLDQKLWDIFRDAEAWKSKQAIPWTESADESSPANDPWNKREIVYYFRGNDVSGESRIFRVRVSQSGDDLIVEELEEDPQNPTGEFQGERQARYELNYDSVAVNSFPSPKRNTNMRLFYVSANGGEFGYGWRANLGGRPELENKIADRKTQEIVDPLAKGRELLTSLSTAQVIGRVSRNGQFEPIVPIPVSA